MILDWPRRNIRDKHFALQWGYQCSSDLPHGITVCLIRRICNTKGGSRYRYTLHASWAGRPSIVWRHRHWAVGEAGMVRGMPVYRTKPLRWYQLIGGIGWPHSFWFERQPHDGNGSCNSAEAR